LRTNRKLQAGMVITVEPGVYFNVAVLEKVFDNPEQAKYLNKKEIEQYWGFGGVRIEDDVIVTETGCENMTIAPRTIDDIEAFMASSS